MSYGRLFSVRQAAERLGLKEPTIRRMIAQGRIDTIRPSARAVRIPEQSIERILEKGFRPAVVA